jgi:hypothetical protein
VAEVYPTFEVGVPVGRSYVAPMMLMIIYIYIYINERGVPGGALNLNYTGDSDHGRYGDLPLQGKIPMAEPGIEPGTSWLVVRCSNHQATRLVILSQILNVISANICVTTALR